MSRPKLDDQGAQPSSLLVEEARDFLTGGSDVVQPSSEDGSLPETWDMVPEPRKSRLERNFGKFQIWRSSYAVVLKAYLAGGVSILDNASAVAALRACFGPLRSWEENGGSGLIKMDAEKAFLVFRNFQDATLSLHGRVPREA